MKKVKRPVKVRSKLKKRGVTAPSLLSKTTKPYQNTEAANKASIGNKHWQLRSKHGVDKIFSNPEVLWDAAVEYFEWVDANPLKEAKLTSFKGVPVVQEINVMRAMTMSQLCFHLGVSESYFRVFKATQKDKEEAQDFLTIISKIEGVIRDQKFQGASGNLLNANIIARDLGLVDKRDLTTDGEKITAPPLQCFTSAPPLAGDEKEVESK